MYLGDCERGRKPKNIVSEAEAEAEAATGDKEGRGWKRRKSAQEVDVSGLTAKRVQVSEVPEQPVAPVARII